MDIYSNPPPYTQTTSHRSMRHSIDYYAMPKAKESIDKCSVHTRILHQEYPNLTHRPKQLWWWLLQPQTALNMIWQPTVQTSPALTPLTNKAIQSCIWYWTTVTEKFSPKNVDFDHCRSKCYFGVQCYYYYIPCAIKPKCQLTLRE